MVTPTCFLLCKFAHVAGRTTDSAITAANETNLSRPPRDLLSRQHKDVERDSPTLSARYMQCEQNGTGCSLPRCHACLSTGIDSRRSGSRIHARIMCCGALQAPCVQSRSLPESKTSGFTKQIPAEDELKRTLPITTLFLDIGGMLLMNGRDHLAGRSAAGHLKLKWVELDRRHRLVCEADEEDNLPFDEYLAPVVTYEGQTFTRDYCPGLMFGQLKAYPRMLDISAVPTARHGLRSILISNESRAVNAQGVGTLRRARLAEMFISSLFFIHTSRMSPALSLLLTRPRSVRTGPSSSTTRRRSTRSRNVAACAASFMPITRLHVPGRPLSDCTCSK